MNPDGYLIDSNHLSAIHHEHPLIVERMKRCPEDTVFRVSCISIGEMEAAHRFSPTTDQAARDRFSVFVAAKYRKNSLNISEQTANYYAEIMAAIFQKHPQHNPKKRPRTEHYLVELGLDINDVWIVAQALEHGLILLTDDRMKLIFEAVGNRLRTENWLRDPL